MAKRTDVHRPGAIVPAEYAFVLAYDLPTTHDGFPIPGYGINCELLPTRPAHSADGRCCLIGLRKSGAVFAETGGAGKCSVCGACYIYGEVWQHTPTGEHIHIGHDCADKYNLLTDRSAEELARDRRRAAAAVEVTKVLNAGRKAKLFAANPGLEAALAGDHAILRDLARKVTGYGLSDKQIALALKIAGELATKPVEVLVPAPTGKALIVRGTVVGLKWYESSYGGALKMTVKVETPAGNWLAWGTVPRGLDAKRGDVVEFTANLDAGREPHFALIGRPRKGTVITPAPENIPASEPVGAPAL